MAKSKLQKRPGRPGPVADSNDQHVALSEDHRAEAQSPAVDQAEASELKGPQMPESYIFQFEMLRPNKNLTTETWLKQPWMDGMFLSYLLA